MSEARPGGPLLSVQNLKVHFPVRSGLMLRQTGKVKAVDGVALEIGEGETVGLVGESGCGKSTLAKAVVRLLKPNEGTVTFGGTEITALAPRVLRPFRREMQMIFQDPVESLNPRQSVRQIIEEPLVIHREGDAGARRRRVDELLERVGLPPNSGEKFAFEFSGGQRQRIGIARAIALNPRFIVCDEPVSALDVSVQSQIINLLLELQSEMGISYLFIAHDLAVVQHISDQVAVMYLGKIVELASAEAIYQRPCHAYTKALLSAIPEADPAAERERILLEGDVPSPINPPAGSAFGHRISHPRYEETIGMDLSLVEIESGHWVARDPCCLSEEDWKKVQ
ncbi:MAG: ATP-binding cassette domain-containing protein [Roseibacillus sp.]|jgi:peptide/nickel transport system ATP-binding protein/oligopeptide transport system ATP-binding protein|nr:ATP-binding cassette domain-containing protein [Roseibacillus sp.]MDP7307651.1 ATP-binding cassette domain-containing protein [Roseibacillus sp.]|tara:strand:- start:620 stop:1636 length:1017 start_codon:yes stop_codon:yes gene_type:complete